MVYNKMIWIILLIISALLFVGTSYFTYFPGDVPISRFLYNKLHLNPLEI